MFIISATEVSDFLLIAIVIQIFSLLKDDVWYLLD